jgi:hypothetical protein
MKCTYCGRRIWWFQNRAPDSNGYIHSTPFGCKWHKFNDRMSLKIEAILEIKK